MKKKYCITWFDFGLWRNVYIQQLLQVKFQRDSGIFLNKNAIRVGWGYKPSGLRAKEIAVKHQQTYLLLEDGFLRSVGLGVKGYPPLSLVIDELGIYYDAFKPSKLEQLINDDAQIAVHKTQAQKAWDLIVQYELSKYNHAPSQQLGLNDAQLKKTKVLIIDQTLNDMAITHGGADKTTFQAMFEAAKQENPEALLIIKTHPDVISGKKQGNLTQYIADEQVITISTDLNPINLLKQVDKVYTVTSQMGFEALLVGRPVVTFGVPWYAGWGVTDDRHTYVSELQQQKRRSKCDILSLFTAAYLLYPKYINPKYINPNTGTKGTIFDVIDYLHKLKKSNDLLRGELYIVGMSWWKRSIVKPFLNYPSVKTRFVSSIQKLTKINITQQTKILAWGNKSPELQSWAQQHNLVYIRMEDGFIRSVGLGSNLVPPLSLVLDDLGIYFDASQTSRLEAILQNTDFSPTTLIQAQELKNILITQNVAKYNVGQGGIKLPENKPEQIILVPGQVESDASIKYGSAIIKTNLDLLKKVRQLNPNAYIIYKPHPDVVSGNRDGKIVDDEILKYTNDVVIDADILACIQQVDEVHTMTSLTGFEALLRGKMVVCYGMPFYAGWGLTTDLISNPRRTKKLNLDELIAGSLIEYPIYIEPLTGRHIDVFSALELLEKDKANNFQQTLKQSILSKQFNKLKFLLALLLKKKIY